MLSSCLLPSYRFITLFLSSNLWYHFLCVTLCSTNRNLSYVHNLIKSLFYEFFFFHLLKIIKTKIPTYPSTTTELCCHYKHHHHPTITGKSSILKKLEISKKKKKNRRYIYFFLSSNQTTFRFLLTLGFSH